MRRAAYTKLSDLAKCSLRTARNVEGSNLALNAQIAFAQEAEYAAPVVCRLSSSHTQFFRQYAKPPKPQDTPHDHEHVNIENEIEKELQRAGDRGGIKGLLQVIEAHGEDFDEMNVTTCFHELAKIAQGKSKEELEEMHVHDTFQTLVDMVVLGRRRFNARHLTSVIQSAVELHFDDEGFMDKISQNLLGRMDRLDAIEVTDLATGLAALEHSPSVVLFEALQKRAEDIKEDFSEEQIKALKEAYKKLGYEDYGKNI